jgi:hypothetical protein
MPWDTMVSAVGM